VEAISEVRTLADWMLANDELFGHGVIATRLTVSQSFLTAGVGSDWCFRDYPPVLSAKAVRVLTEAYPGGLAN